MDKPHAQMPPPAKRPATKLPTGACDTHVHMLAGKDDFPLWEGRVESPAPGPDFDGWMDLYRQHLETLGLSRGVIVHSILYGDNNAVTLRAVRELGADFCGVGLLRDGASAADVRAFADQNIKAVRLNYVHGGVLTWDGARAMAPHLADNGMHIQMLIHADQHMDALADDIRAASVPVVLDHIGWPSAGLNPNAAGIDTMCALMEEGHLWVKLSGPYRTCNAPYTQATALVQRLADTAPDQCLWGSDWPHIMLNGAQMPHAAEMLDHLAALLTPEQVQGIFVDNPARLYGFEG